MIFLIRSVNKGGSETTGMNLNHTFTGDLFVNLNIASDDKTDLKKAFSDSITEHLKTAVKNIAIDEAAKAIANLKKEQRPIDTPKKQGTGNANNYRTRLRSGCYKQHPPY